MTDLLTERDAAEKLHVCTRTLRRLRQSGAIRYVSVTPRTILYRPEDVAAFVEQRTKLEQSPAPTEKTRPNRKRVESNIVSFTARRAQRRGMG